MAQNGQITIYITSFSVHRKVRTECKKCVGAFKAKKIPFVEVDVAKDRKVYDVMVAKSSVKELPQVWVDDLCIGVWKDIEEWLEDDCLIQALTEAGWISSDRKELPKRVKLPDINPETLKRDLKAHRDRLESQKKMIDIRRKRRKMQEKQAVDLPSESDDDIAPPSCDDDISGDDFPPDTDSESLPTDEDIPTDDDDLPPPSDDDDNLEERKKVDPEHFQDPFEVEEDPFA